MMMMIIIIIIIIIMIMMMMIIVTMMVVVIQIAMMMMKTSIATFSSSRRELVCRLRIFVDEEKMPPFEAISKIAPFSLNPDGGSTITNHGPEHYQYVQNWKYSLEIQLTNAVEKCRNS